MKNIKNIKCKRCQNNLTSLRAGDILLYSNVNSRVSKIVSYFIKSKFIHVGIYIEGKDTHELIYDKKGYSKYPIFRTISHFHKDVMVLRPRIKINKSYLKKMSMRYEGSEYSVRTALRIFFARLHNIRFPSNGRMVCSVVVAKIYEDMGIDLFPRLDVFDVLPADFLDCDLLERVDL